MIILTYTVSILLLLPAVVSVQTASNEPRFMDYKIKPWAFAEGRVTVWNQADLAAEAEYIGTLGSPTIVSGLDEAASRERKRIILAGSVDEQVAQLVKVLVEVV